MKRRLVAVLLVSMIVMGAAPVWAKRQMSDARLDSVTAGTSVTAQRIGKELQFEFHKDNGHIKIDGDGSFSVNGSQLPSGGLNAFILRDSTQHALVNINAINSVIQVLLNLNVNINSNVGTLTQGNLGRNFGQ